MVCSGAGRSLAGSRECSFPLPPGPRRVVTGQVTIRTGNGGGSNSPLPQRSHRATRPAAASARSLSTVRRRSDRSTSTTIGAPSGRAHPTSTQECRCWYGAGRGSTLGALR